MPLIDFRRARAEIRLSVVLELLGWQARTRQGEQVRGPCPVHGSQSPSSRVFAAHLGRNLWHCFRCGAGGNALDLWVQVRRRPLYAAVLELYHRLGRTVPWREPVPRPSPNKAKREEKFMSA
jgi:DNA primase